MAIERVSVPTPSAPVGAADYTAILAQLEAKNQAFTMAWIIDGSTIRAGRVFDIGGVLYRATSDTAISGTASDYVKITASGSTATAAFVSSLSGVTWNNAYGGYYHSDGSLVVFDEAKAVLNGVITTPRTLPGIIAASSMSQKRMEVFFESGSWVCPNGVTTAWITAIGGGGNGGDGGGGNGAGGGGSGACVIKAKVTVVPGTTYAVGIGGSTDTTFGALLTIGAGGDGVDGDAGGGGAAGELPTITSGVGIAIAGIVGSDGDPGFPQSSGAGSTGSASPYPIPEYGYGGARVPYNDADPNGRNGGIGAGGSGAVQTGTGGAGGPGFLVVEW